MADTDNQPAIPCCKCGAAITIPEHPIRYLPCPECRDEGFFYSEVPVKVVVDKNGKVSVSGPQE